METVLKVLRPLAIKQNKKFYILLLGILVALYIRFLKNKDKYKRKLVMKFIEDHKKIRAILKELEVEANFMLNVAYLKYKDKSLLSSDHKKF